ncbi:MULTISPECIES: TetR/AcrR family transcriptional regulator [Nocardioides]|uniref:TetR/AcrR family transcriptional regulator n=1 Tax=Nocardioides TaxID=1839 RepID=UPI00032EBFA3|nr:MULTISPECIES: TetR/AcrR family transcriptional regulator [Nocardioides]EON22497.1 transcriptional regulator, TetR family [Nocardioides sp. CF8]
MEQDRRQFIARTALQVLSTAGARGLTHRAVDTAAAVPAGSTSYYFRTRAALLGACLDDLVAQDHVDLDVMAPLVAAADADTMAAALADLLERWLTSGRERHIARYELSMEALRRPDLADRLHAGGLTIRNRVGEALAAMGADDATARAHWLVAALDGILFDRLVGANAAASVDHADLVSVAQRLTAGALAPRP